MANIRIRNTARAAYTPPCIFFHGLRPRWDSTTNPALHELPSLNNAPSNLLPSLHINVSRPDTLSKWLTTNSPALITDLTIMLDANKSDAQVWFPLLDKLAREATNIQTLCIYWDAEGWTMTGLGRSVPFVQKVAQLEVQKSVEICGFYAPAWPAFLEERMGLRPLDRQDSEGWRGEKRKYQRFCEGLDPWAGADD